MTLSSTLKPGNGRTSWNVRPIPRRQTASAESPLMRAPENTIDPVSGVKHAGDHVEERRLAGAVRPDHAADLARRHVEVDPVDGGQAAKMLADALDGEERHGFSPLMPSRRASHGQTPPGSATITKSRQMP